MTGRRPPVRAFREHFLSPVADHLRTPSGQTRPKSGHRPGRESPHRGGPIGAGTPQEGCSHRGVLCARRREAYKLS